jgi:predicted nuclease of predicted toxin-antitoxin system
VRVLLDANLPRGLGRLLAGHEVVSAHAHAWSDLDDGALLDAAAAAGYAAFLTMDQSLRFQQNLAGRSLAVVLLRARSNRLPDLRPLAAAVLAALPEAPPGEVTVIAA